MQHEQEKYDPVILNLSKSQDIAQPRNYLRLFVGSIILLGLLLVSSAWYVLTHSGQPGPDESPQGGGAAGKATVVVEATPVPTAAPTVTPMPTATPVPTVTPSPKVIATVAEDVPPTPEAKPQTGYLSLNSAPEQADVTIDGRLLGQTPLKNYELEVGDYQVTFSYDGQLFTQMLNIRAGETTEYTQRFEGFGSLQIDTTSSGCEVYVNGQLRGKSPLLVEGLSPGNYTIVLKKVGFHTTEIQVSLRKGEHQDLFLTIKRLGSRSSSSSDSPGTPLHPSERLRN